MRREIAARTLYEKLYCARGDMENRRPHQRRDDARQPVAALVRRHGLRLAALRRRALAHTELARATCGTIRNQLLKFGALVTVSVRRVRVAMASAGRGGPLFDDRAGDAVAGVAARLGLVVVGPRVDD